MKILIVGDMYSIHTYNFINETLLKMNIDKIVIWGVNSKPTKDVEDSYDLFYKKNNIHIIKELDNRDKFYDLIKGFERAKEFGVFDICHLHYLGYSTVTIGLLVKDICKKLISNYWGSDWLRSNDTQKQYQKYLLKLSDYIVADSMQICNQVNNYYNMQFKEKIKYIRFKTPVISKIQSGEITTNIKKQFIDKHHIPSDKIIVTCGYNASETHRHKDIIKAIKNLSKENINKLFVIIPMTYGNHQEYIEDIKQILKESIIDGIVLENYMDFREVALLRLVTDIFINVEPTDAYSSTMIEYAYCNKITIIGSWLDYSELEKRGVYLKKIDEIEELTRVLKEALNKIEDIQKLFSNNRAASENFQEDKAGNELWEEIYYAKPLIIEQTVLSENTEAQKIKRWIEQNNYLNIGIYGVGILGGVAYHKIADVIDEERIYIFDKNISNVNWCLNMILKPEMLEEKELNVVIITPGSCMDELKAKYSDKISYKILTYVEWLAEIDSM